MTRPRPTGRGFAAGDHVVWAYETPEARRRVVQEYLAGGLAAGERLVYVAPDPHEQLQADLAGWALRAVDLVRAGRLLVMSTADAYFPDGVFDADVRIGEYAQLVEASVQGGFSGLRVAADATPLLQGVVAASDWLAYELRADVLSTRLPFSALCAYDRERSDPETLELLESVHGDSLCARDEPAGPFRLRARDGALALEGEVDLTCAEAVRDLLVAASVDLDAPVLDVSGLGFIDVTGIRALLDAAGCLRHLGGPVTVTGASPSFRRIWEALVDEDAAVRLARNGSGGA